MKRIVSGLIAAVMLLAAFSGLSLTVSAHVSHDALFINNSVYGKGALNYNNSETITISPGDRIYILGWVAFSTTDGLKEIKYSIDGTEYACSDVYRDRPDVVNAVAIYNNGEHAGYGKDEKMMELLGIDELEAGEYHIAIKAIYDDGHEAIIKEFDLTVK